MSRIILSSMMLVMAVNLSLAQAPQETIKTKPSGPLVYPPSTSPTFASEQSESYCPSVPIRPKVIVQVPQPEIVIEEDVPTYRGKLKGGRTHSQAASNIYTVSNLQPMGLGFGVQGMMSHGVYGLGLQPFGLQTFGLGTGIQNQDFSELRTLYELNALSSQLAVHKAQSEFRSQLVQKYSQNVLKGMQHSTQGEAGGTNGSTPTETVLLQFQSINKKLDDISNRLANLESHKMHEKLDTIKTTLEQMSITLEAIKPKK